MMVVITDAGLCHRTVASCETDWLEREDPASTSHGHSRPLCSAWPAGSEKYQPNISQTSHPAHYQAGSQGGGWVTFSRSCQLG